jgi:diguanylate cyclase (GGDEF)-like protein
MGALLLFPTLGWTSPGDKEGLPVLTSTRAVQALPATEATRGYPVKLRGAITYVNQRDAELFLEDERGGIAVALGGVGMPGGLHGGLRAGQIVEVAGVSCGGDFSPSVTASSIRAFSDGVMPEPAHLSFDKLVVPMQDAHWVEFEGVVRSDQVRDGRLFLNVGTPGGTFVAIVQDYEARPKYSLVDARVAIRGVVSVITNRHRQATGIRLLVPTVACMRVEATGPLDPFALPLVPLVSIGQFQTAVAFNRRIHVRGTVVAVEPDRTMYISDGQAFLTIVPSTNCRAATGEMDDFVGFQGALHSRPALVDTICSAAGAGSATAHTGISVRDAVARVSYAQGTARAMKDAARFDMALVKIEGTLLDILPGQDSYTLSLEDRGTPFTATLPIKAKDAGALPTLRSRVSLTGLSLIGFDPFRGAETLRLLLREPADLVVISRPPWLNLQHAMWCVTLLGGLFFSAMVWASILRGQVVRQTRELRMANEALVQLSTHDPLTGVANRRKLDEVLGAEFGRMRRVGKPLSLAMVDIDHFKSFNDACGHQEGDECLARVAHALESAVRRETDLVARYGGEEFAGVLPFMGRQDAFAVAERMRSAIEGLAIEHPGMGNERLSVSIGVATCDPDERGGVARLVAQADRALYQAKALGRNRTVVLESVYEERLSETSIMANLMSCGAGIAGTPPIEGRPPE